MDIKFMVRVIEDYIYHRKDVRVTISPRPNEIGLIYTAYTIAHNWFNQNKVN